MADERIPDIATAAYGGAPLDILAEQDLWIVHDSSDTTDDPDGTTRNTTVQILQTYLKTDINTYDKLNSIVADVTLSHSSLPETLTNKSVNLPFSILDISADHKYVFAVSELTADQTVLLPLLTTSDTFVFEQHAQTLSAKTLSDATLSGVIDASGATSFSVGNYAFNIDEPVGVGQDGYVLTYDNGTGEIGLQAVVGGFTSFTVAADSGTPQVITDGNTLTVSGGTGISTTVGATDTVTINVSGYVGEATITTVGTITSGTWLATAIGDAHIASAATWNAKIANVSEDTTPQLGGDLDANGNTIYFGTAENTQTPSGTTATIDLGAENHHTLDLGNASGAVTLTLTVPAGPTAGTIVIKQGAIARDITWSPSAGTAKWLGTEPTWTGDTNKFRVVTWRYWPTSPTYLLLASTDTD